jgi:hypothetical protein
MKDISKHVPKMQDVGEKLRIVCCDIICQVFDCDKVFLVSKADQMVEEEEAWEYIWSDMFWNVARPVVERCSFIPALHW